MTETTERKSAPVVRAVTYEPYIRSVEYYPDGTIKRIEYQDWPEIWRPTLRRFRLIRNAEQPPAQA